MSTLTPLHKDWRRLALVAGITIAVLLPFINKAFNIDDVLFLVAARQIRQHPLDFFGCSFNWYGVRQPLASITKNPPLTSYFLALSSTALGWSEPALHGSFLAVAAAAAAGIYAVARRFCSRPIEASLIAVATPAFLVSATSVMSDIPMLAAFCWAVEFWLRGLESRRQLDFAVSSLLVVVAALSKYFAISLIPLLLVATLLWRRAPDASLLWLVAAAFLLGLYEFYTIRIYGRGLIGAAMEYGRTHHPSLVLSGIDLLLGASVYPGGCLVTILLFAPLACSYRSALALALAALLISFGLVLQGRFGGLVFRSQDGIAWPGLSHAVIFAVASVFVWGMAVTDLHRRRDASSVFLFLWLAGTWIFTIYFNWTINARSIVPVVPVVGILLARRIDDRSAHAAVRNVGLARAAVFASLAVGMVVAQGDYAVASMERTAARRVLQEHPADEGRLWFWGHWGFQYYMEAAGAKPWDFSQDTLSRGDLIAVAVNSPSATGNDVGARVLLATSDRLGDFQISAQSVVTTLSMEWPANFYVFSPLPFAFGVPDTQEYTVLAPRQEILPPARNVRRQIW